MYRVEITSMFYYPLVLGPHNNSISSRTAIDQHIQENSHLSQTVNSVSQELSQAKNRMSEMAVQLEQSELKLREALSDNEVVRQQQQELEGDSEEERQNLVAQIEAHVRTIAELQHHVEELKLVNERLVASNGDYEYVSFCCCLRNFVWYARSLPLGSTLLLSGRAKCYIYCSRFIFVCLFAVVVVTYFIVSRNTISQDRQEIPKLEQAIDFISQELSQAKLRISELASPLEQTEIKLQDALPEHEVVCHQRQELESDAD